MRFRIINFAFSNRGYTLTELLVSLSISATLLGATSATFLNTTRQAGDHEIVTRTREYARSVLDLVAFDLRMTGSGMPLNQEDFSIDDLTLGEAPLPLLSGANDDFIQIRLNERGFHTVLTSAYTPSATSLNVTVYDSSNFSDGDLIYISDMISNGENGLQGEITNVGPNTLTIDSAFVASPSATFPIGSTVHRITQVDYLSPNDGSGIMRDPGDGGNILAPRSTFTLDYVDSAGTSLLTPLTAADIADNLSAIELTVSVQSEQRLKNGEFYTAQFTEYISLRNLNLSR